METNFKEVCKRAVDELCDMNENTMKSCNVSFEECFPAYLYRTVDIDGEEKGIKIEITVL